MRHRRFRWTIILIALSLFGLGWLLLIAAWRWSRLGGWDADDGTR